MFTLQTRMSDALAQRPELRTLLPAFHPAFSRLSHPVLGKVLPRLVTVADAAKIAGVDPAALLAVMELPGPPPGIAHGTERRDEPAPEWLALPTRTLDVRPALDAGEEPFVAIMGAIRELPPGQVLTVLAPFEPAPLRRLLGDRGWESHVAWADDACRCSFWRAADGLSSDAPVDPGDRLTRGPTGATLDVRDLPPPEPMRLTLAAVADPANLPLRLLHHRVPALLFPKLQERGLTWSVVEDGDQVVVEIRGT